MQKELESLWQQCVAFHGHGCGGLAVGFRAVLYAWELFESDSTSEDEGNRVHCRDRRLR